MKKSNWSPWPEAASEAWIASMPAITREGWLVIGGHQQRGPHVQRRQRPGGGDPQPPAAARQARDEPRHGADQAERDPGEQRHEHDQQRHDQRGDPAGIQHAQHLVRGHPRHGDRRQDHAGPPQPHQARAARQTAGARRVAMQRLLPASPAAFPAAARGTPSALRRAAAPASCRPSIHPGLRQRRVALHQPGMQFDERLPAWVEREAEAPAALFRVGLPHDVQQLAPCRRSHPVGAAALA